MRPRIIIYYPMSEVMGWKNEQLPTFDNSFAYGSPSIYLLPQIFVTQTLKSRVFVQALINGDARDLTFLGDESIHLVVTSPPYWNLKRYNENPDQLGHVNDYESFLRELEKVWKEVFRVLVPGGRLVCVVGDVCVSRRKFGRHLVFPLHADICVLCRKICFDNLNPIIPALAFL